MLRIIGLFLVFLLNPSLSFSQAGGGNPFEKLLSPKASGPDQSFLIRAQCKHSCRKAPSDGRARATSSEAKGRFDPAAFELKNGNGGMVSMLGISIWQFGEDLCVQRAETWCGSRSNVESVQALSLSSGQWQMKEAPSCPDPKNPQRKLPKILSPYDRRVVSSLEQGKAAVTEKRASPRHVWARGPVFKKDSEASSCQHVLTGQLCGGDCLDGDGSEECQALCTAEPLGEMSMKVCADGWIKEAAAKDEAQNADDLLKFECESFFWNSLKTAGKGFIACAAVRGQVQCEEVIAALKKTTSRQTKAITVDEATQEPAPAVPCPACKQPVQKH